MSPSLQTDRSTSSLVRDERILPEHTLYIYKERLWLEEEEEEEESKEEEEELVEAVVVEDQKMMTETRKVQVG